MADALRSGRSVRKGVGVQISPSAPNLTREVRIAIQNRISFLDLGDKSKSGACSSVG